MLRQLALRGIAIALFAVGLAAQTTTVGSGAVVGTIRDTTGAVIPGVEITCENVGTRAARRAVSDTDGDFTLTNLAIGFYTLRARKSGFKTGVQERFELQVDQRVRIDLVLQVGEVSETISVQAAAPLLETDSATVGSVVSHERMVELPLNGRNFLALLSIVPGANPGRAGIRQATNSGGFTASVNGQREASNNLTVDGIDSNDPINNYMVVRPNLEAIAEFKVQTGLSDAEFGRNGGAQINVVTRGGTNDFHGTLFEYLRNDKLDAKNYFSLLPKTPPLKQNQFGGVFGGRIVRDKTFFFLDYQGTRVRRGLNRVTRVPDQDLRSGNFAGQPAVRDPMNGNQPFPNNRIPAERMDPIAQKILGYVPLPNNPSDPARNWNTDLSSSQNVRQYGARVDQQLSARDSFFVRFSGADDDGRLPGSFDTPAIGNASLFVAGVDIFQPYRLVSVSETHIFSPSMVNELRLGYSRSIINRFHLNYGTDYAAQLGIQGAISSPLSSGFPNVSITGFAALGNGSFLPNLHVSETRQITDNFLINKGKHSIKMGGDLRWQRMDGLFPSDLRGAFNFDGSFTGTPMADFLLGYVRSVSVTRQDDHVRLRYPNYGFYAQDTFTVLPSLTLTLGLRYEYIGTPYEIYDRISTFDLSTGKIIPAGTPGWPRSLRDTDKDNFAPRFGLAWRPFGNNRTVVRAGYGVFFNIDSINPQANRGQNPPFSYTNSLIANPPNNTLSFATGLTGVTAPLTPSVTFQDRNFRDGYVQHFMFGLQREVMRGTVVEGSYVGTKGTKLGRYANPNQPTPGPGAIQPRRPYPDFSGISEYMSSSNSSFHSVQGRVERQFNAGLTFLAAYTYGKVISDAEEVFEGPYDTRNLRLQRSLAGFDVRHRFVFSGSYSLPFGRGRQFFSGAQGAVRHLVEGWQLLTLTALQSGNPFTVTIGTDISNIGSGNRPDRIAKGTIDNPTIQRWFDAGAFRAHQPFTIGNAGRNILIGPGMYNIDFSIFKNFVLTERVRLQFRTEFFNLFNTPQFSNPASNISVPSTVGTISSTRVPERQIQFALRLEF
jgi:hypothetical protein